MQVFRMNETVVLPTFGTKGSAGFDISANLQNDAKIISYNPHGRTFEMPVKRRADGVNITTLQPQFRTLVPTGLIFDIPTRHVLKVYIRSGIALKRGLALANATAIIDSDYTDELFIMLINHSDTPIIIADGERIAQGLLEKSMKVVLEEVTERPGPKEDRVGGLGSTGV